MTQDTLKVPPPSTVAPMLARWATPARFVPGSSTSIGSDDTSTYRSDTEDSDT